MSKGFSSAELQPFPVRPFAPNIPALDLFPTRIWNRLTNRVQRNPGRHLMNYGESAGFRPLRRAIADYVADSRGVNCEADQVIVTSGTQKAIHLSASLLLDPEDQVLMEDPGGVLAGQVFQAQGAKLRAAPVDNVGLDVARALAMAPNAKLAYVTPSCQYPLGVTLPVSRTSTFSIGRHEDQLGFWRTMRTASSASSAGPYPPCRAWTGPDASFTPGVSAKCSFHRYVWGCSLCRRTW